jgi:hypothetical protein
VGGGGGASGSGRPADGPEAWMEDAHSSRLRMELGALQAELQRWV